MKKESLTAQRNKKIVGKNCKSYNDKHPEHPWPLRPIHDAILQVQKIIDIHGAPKPNYKRIAELRRMGTWAKPAIMAAINAQ
jgi:hypothetical protein